MLIRKPYNDEKEGVVDVNMEGRKPDISSFISSSIRKFYHIIKTQFLCPINTDVLIYSLGRNNQDYSLTKHSEVWLMVNSNWIALFINMETFIISFYTYHTQTGIKICLYG